MNGRTNHWKKLGIYFGYPKCCIKAFCEGKTEHRLVISKGTGFVPCNTCTMRIIKGEIKLNDLIVKRKHSQKFPLDDGPST